MQKKLLAASGLFVIAGAAIWTIMPNADILNAFDAPSTPEKPSTAAIKGDAAPTTSAPLHADGENGPNVASYELLAAEAQLPPANTPLRDTFADLDRRAKSGDAVASCRLSADIFRCEQLPMVRQDSLDAISTAANKTPGTPDEQRAIRRATILRDSIARDERLCEGFDQIAPHTAWDYLKLAAANGNPHAMVQLAVAPPLDSTNFLRDVEQWVEYKQLAGPYLRQAAFAGEPYALFHLWWISAGYPSAGGDAIPRSDPYMTYVLGHAILQIGDARVVEMVQRYFGRNPGTLTIAQEAQAKLEALELARSKFGRISKANLNNFPPKETHCTGQVPFKP